MQFRKTPIAVAVLALTSAMPIVAQAAPSVSWTTPQSGAVLSGRLTGSACAVSTSGTSRVTFNANSWQINNDYSGPFNCDFDTTRLKDGSYTLRARAFDSSGAYRDAFVPVTIKNSGTTSSGTTTTPTSGTAPTIAFTAPAEGGTLSGNVQGPPNCIVQGSNIAKVMFYLNDRWTNTDGNLSNGLGCWIDTTRYANGTYTVKAVAYNSAGATATTTRTIKIQNGTTSTPTEPAPTEPAPTGSTISSSDIIGQASQEVPFAQQSGYGGQVLGKYPSPPQIPDTTGIEGSLLPNGERMRLGKQADPSNTSKKALVFQLAPSDPITSGSKRAEIGFGKNIEYNKVYWLALRVYVKDWGSLASNDVAIFGTQVHSGDNSRGLSPSFSLVANNGGRSFQIYTVTSTSTSPSQSTSVTTRHPSTAIPFGRWVDFVFKFRLNVSGNGFLQAWMDGSQILNYQGNLGFNTPGYNDYAKFGYYNWSAGFNTPRKVMLKSPTIVRDPTGSTYSAAALRAHINK